MSTVDPVSEASEYQQMLLGLLGDDDPAEVQRETLARWRALLSEAGDDHWTRPAAGEWSVLELLGHAADAELVVGGRYRWILSHDRPPLMPYDQDKWTSALDHQSADPGELLARIGMHEERGPESYDLTFRLLAGHDRFHVEQARRTLDEVRSKA